MSEENKKTQEQSNKGEENPALDQDKEQSPDKSGDFAYKAKIIAVAVTLSFLVTTPIAAVTGLYLSKKVSNGLPPLIAVVDMEQATEDAMRIARKSRDSQKAANLVVASILSKANEMKQRGYVILDKKSVLAMPDTIEIIEWKSVYKEMKENGQDPMKILGDQMLQEDEVDDLIDMSIFEK